MGLRDRLSRLEGKAGSRSSRLVSDEIANRLRLAREKECRVELESMAYDLAAGSEPLLTVRRDMSFYTPGGHLVLNSEFEDVGALYGKEARECAESLPSDRWEEFLDSDSEAMRLLSTLEEIAEKAADDVPDDYRTWFDEWESLVCDLSIREGLEHEIPAEPDTEEHSRRLAWVLLHDPEALEILAALLARRDEFFVVS